MDGRRFSATRMIPNISQTAGRAVVRTFSIGRLWIAEAAD
jgi:hypothetical protein